MMENSLISGVYPVVTIKEKNRIRRFVCNSVMVSQREGCTILTFFRPSEEAVQYWGNRAHGGEHLTGEWFENPRIATHIIKAYNKYGRVDLKGMPPVFTVRTNSNPRGGEGHMKFFYDKLTWLRNRYLSLIEEMRRRGYNPSDNWKPEIFEPQFQHLFNDWTPTDYEVSLSRTRIAEMVPRDNDLNAHQLSELTLLPEYQIIFKR